MTGGRKGDDYIILMNCTIIISHIRKLRLQKTYYYYYYYYNAANEIPFQINDFAQ